MAGVPPSGDEKDVDAQTPREPDGAHDRPAVADRTPIYSPKAPGHERITRF